MPEQSNGGLVRRRTPPAAVQPAAQMTRAVAETTVQTERRTSGQVVDEAHAHETLPRRLAVGPHGSVTVQGSSTQNMGDYNSIRVGVEITVPCEPTMTGYEEAYRWASDWVDEKIQLELDTAMGTGN